LATNSVELPDVCISDETSCVLVNISKSFLLKCSILHLDCNC
jgi:hypothetical protein